MRGEKWTTSVRSNPAYSFGKADAVGSKKKKNEIEAMHQIGLSGESLIDKNRKNGFQRFGTLSRFEKRYLMSFYSVVV